jgi:drug/metabolite transporter (DMT)-like permease
VIAWRNPGVLAAFAAAALFGASTPAAKLLLGSTSPWLLAALLYLGSGLGLLVVRLALRSVPVRLPAGERGWLAAAIACGGIVAPVLLLYGLVRMPASGASLLLNAEGLFTALIAWIAFKENFDRRILAGMIAIVAGAAVLSWPGEADFGAIWPALAVIGACFAWGLDNNLTRRVSLSDATFIAMAKGLAAGTVNLGLALALGASPPPVAPLAGALVLGFLSYGLSLTLFVVALRHLGTARTGAYFSTAPFAGALIALTFLQEPVTWQLGIAGVLMGVGVWLHLSERHEHAHAHETLEHAHEHEHDEHHRHEHEQDLPAGSRHSHSHRHDPLRHSHPHFPDAHHRHRH